MSAWAVMNYLGEEGYLRVTERVLATRRALQQGAAELGLPTLGDPQLAILAYACPDHDVPAVSRAMTARGWVMGHTTEPPGIHHMLNLTHEPAVGGYLADLADALKGARLGPDGQRGTLQARY